MAGFFGQAFGGINLYYGAGFANGSQGIPGSPYNDAYLPSPAQIDLSPGKEFREKYTFAVERGECGKPPSLGRQQPHFWRLSITTRVKFTWISLQISFLRCNRSVWADLGPDSSIG
jgi:hypothetical protein